MPASLHFVTIVVPALNEERYIAGAILSILPGAHTLDYEVLVLDGGSEDRTCQIVEDLASQNPRIKLLHNERRIQSSAMNIAAELCDRRSTILVRADCHARYPKGFVESCVNTLRSTGSSSVVVAMHAVGRSPLQRAIAAAQNSRLGNGGSQHRMTAHSGFVDHGHHAAFDRATFRALRGYDENAPYNEDAEFDTRLRRAGGRNYPDGALSIDYYPRSSFTSLAKQYYRHGWGRANTLLKHGLTPKPRQVLPVLALLMFLTALATLPVAGALASVPPGVYVAACLFWGVSLAILARDISVLLSGPAANVMHLSWAVGFLARVAELRAALRSWVQRSLWSGAARIP